jgi:hypothetical protein
MSGVIQQQGLLGKQITMAAAAAAAAACQVGAEGSELAYLAFMH